MLEVPVEAPAWAPFGEFAWAKFREGIPEEEDTDVEKEIYADLKRHFNSKHIGLPSRTVSMLLIFQTLG